MSHGDGLDVLRRAPCGDSASLPPFRAVREGDVIVAVVRHLGQGARALLPVLGLAHELVGHVGILELAVTPRAEGSGAKELGVGAVAVLPNARRNAAIHQTVERVDLRRARMELFVAIAHGTRAERLESSDVPEWELGPTGHHVDVRHIFREGRVHALTA